MTAPKQQIVVVTGLSGAGKSTVLRTLEDLGYFCIDNLPTVLAPEAARICNAGGITRLALGIDVRVRTFLDKAGPILDALLAEGREVEVVFCDANDETILRRFSETRRPHALASTGDDASALAVLDGVRIERERLASIRARATRVIDTTNLSVHDLRRVVLSHFGPAAEAGSRMRVRIVSFGFKYGAPVDADLVFDVRFIENPYFVPALKALPGTDERVRDFVMGRPETGEFIEKTLDLLRFVIPRYEREGKSYLTIAIGCTGGRHRSVAISERLAVELHAAAAHRDIGRDPTHVNASLPPGAKAPDAGNTGRFAAVEELSHQLSPLPATVTTGRTDK
ncbi:MAG: RNase adapter RapZ [Polyangiaceae bacterium]